MRRARAWSALSVRTRLNVCARAHARHPCAVYLLEKGALFESLDCNVLDAKGIHHVADLKSLVLRGPQPDRALCPPNRVLRRLFCARSS